MAKPFPTSQISLQFFHRRNLKPKWYVYMVDHLYVPDPFARQAKLQDEIEQLQKKSGERRGQSEQNKDNDVTPGSVGDSIVL